MLINKIKLPNIRSDLSSALETIVLAREECEMRMDIKESSAYHDPVAGETGITMVFYTLFGIQECQFMYTRSRNKRQDGERNYLLRFVKFEEVIE